MGKPSFDEGWYLEGWVEGEPARRRFEIGGFPARIGRHPRLAVTVDITHVSGQHAELSQRSGQMWLSDLGSRNGTHLNGVPVHGEERVVIGDVIRLPGAELQLHRHFDAPELLDVTAVFHDLPSDLGPGLGVLSGGREVREMLRHRAVSAMFQPIVDLRDGSWNRFELLGRGTHRPLPSSPGGLFAFAEPAGLATKLSRLFLVHGVVAASSLPEHCELFVNTHPEEIARADVLRPLQALREKYPDRALVMEVHESGVTDPARMRELKAGLCEIDVGLAYDDFGAGQDRLLELAEAPPDYLKFDIRLVRDIDRAPAKRTRLLESLVQVVHDMGVACLAEGVERKGELEACVQLGFDLVQGFYLGKPLPAAVWRDREGLRRTAANLA